MMIRVYKGGDKEVYKDDKTGIEKVIYTKDPEHIAAVKERLTITPYGPDKKEFFERYGDRWRDRGGGKVADRGEEKKTERTAEYEWKASREAEIMRQKRDNAKYKKFY